MNGIFRASLQRIPPFGPAIIYPVNELDLIWLFVIFQAILNHFKKKAINAKSLEIKLESAQRNTRKMFSYIASCIFINSFIIPL